MKNSTLQLQNTWRTNLEKIRPETHSYRAPLNNNNFQTHDYDNLYQTSYNQMTTRVHIYLLIHRNQSY
jgi:hypothetical protein